MISWGERGESSPTAVVLEKLAAGLGVPLASLFDAPMRAVEPVSRAADQLSWRDPESGYAWFLGTQLNQEDVAVFVAERSGDVIGYVYAGMEPQSWKELREAAGFIQDVVEKIL